MKRLIAGSILAASLLAVTAGPVLAQRSPAYAAARANGSVGERTDGYLGVVGSADPELERLVQDLNNRRRQVYTRVAAEQNATVQEVAFASGCREIIRTTPGEKYQDPNGNWQTRTDAPPVRSPDCPPV